MGIRNLEGLFRPRSVALIGASERGDAIGALVARNLLGGEYTGAVYFVNPKYRRILGRTVYPDLASLPADVDLGVICTPPEIVPEMIENLAARGARGAIILTAGFGESRALRGQELQKQLQGLAQAGGVRVVGPNCLGVMVPGVGLNASFAHRSASRGGLAFATQSGAILTSILDWAESRGVGFTHLVSLGDMVDVDFGDLLDYLANDAETRAILLYIESIGDAREFMSAARAAARMKPVLVVKAGRHAESARAVKSHTGAMAGTDAVYDAAFERAGLLRVFSLGELFDAAQTLGLTRSSGGERLAIVTNGGGIGVLATDALIDAGGRLADLSEATMNALDEALPETWSHDNPVDLVGDADGERYAAALAAIGRDSGVDGVLVMYCPTAVSSAEDVAQAVVAARAGLGERVLLSSWVGDGSAAAARQLFIRNRVPTYATPEQAVRAFMYLIRYHRNQNLLIETPASIPQDYAPKTEVVREILEAALAEQREWLSEYEAKRVLAAYGVPTVSTRLARSPEEVAAAAVEIGGAVVVKIESPELTHKSDVGGVALDLLGPGAARDAAAAMSKKVGASHPHASISGFTVQPMVRRPGAHELIMGMTEDEQFGPVMLVGQGGTLAEAVADRALGLPPLNMRLARDLLARTRIARQLEGGRGQPAANLDAIALTLVRLSQLIIDCAEIKELDVNPLLVDAFGVLALDARIRVLAASAPAEDRLAIRPYPKQLEEFIPLGDDRRLFLRPIRPEDEPALQAAFARLTPEEVRLRFFVPMQTLSHVLAARFTQIDYDREMALILTEPGIAGRTDIFGVVRIIADPDNERAEFAIVIGHELTGLGLGVLLMRRILDYAKQRGIAEVFGEVLRENRTMLKLCEAFGFGVAGVPDEPGLVRVSLRFDAAAPLREAHSKPKPGRDQARG